MTVKTKLEWLLGLREKKKSYETILGPNGVVGHDSMRDLAWFCFAYETTNVIGDRDQSLINEGRRQVWLRLQEYLHLTPEDLVLLYGRVISQGRD